MTRVNIFGRWSVDICMFFYKIKSFWVRVVYLAPVFIFLQQYVAFLFFFSFYFINDWKTD